MIEMICQYLGGIVTIVGGLFVALAAVGLVRFPDVYTRLHAATKAGLLGVGLILLGVGIASGELTMALRSIIPLAFLMLTTPVSSHLLARAAYRAGVRPVDTTVVNDIDGIDNGRSS
jgi:multicomponent Na+:H+ antiporter subunit G